MAKKIYTIGYSGFPETKDFISALETYGVQILIDVRSSPFSKYYEQYNKDRISPLLKEKGIYYFNYAMQFGARQENSAFYRKGRLDFEIFSRSGQFLEGAKNVERSGAVICLMCAEKHPDECHRTILVARALRDRGNPVEHIVPVESGIHSERETPDVKSSNIKNPTIRDMSAHSHPDMAAYHHPDTVTLSQEDIDRKLLDDYFPNREQMSLFSENDMTEEEYIAEAYRCRNDQIGFKQEDLARA